ncbi:MAG: CHAP domain-containing protein [Desulfamplus sp.]
MKKRNLFHTSLFMAVGIICMVIFGVQEVSALSITKPTQTAPANNAVITTASCTFSWTHLYNDQYELKIKDYNVAAGEQQYVYQSGLIKSKSKTVDLSKYLKYGKQYKWYIVVYANNLVDSSTDRYFTYKYGTFPGSVSASPSSGNWTATPQYVSVSCSNANQIYYTIRYTTDGNTPSEPPEPTSSTNDGSISGSSGNFQVYASAGQNKKLKVRFRGYNSIGYGSTTGSFSYAIDLRLPPGSVSVNPSSGNWTSSPQYVSVSSSNANQIYYTIRTTTDGSTPSEPPEPTSSTNDGSISGASGKFQVYGVSGLNKKLKVRFRGYNSIGYGTTTGSFSYAIDLRPPTPGSVIVNPTTSDNWKSTPQYVNVNSSNASQIYYTIRYTTDGSKPSEPPEPTSTVNDGSISGSSGNFKIYGSLGKYKQLKVRFRGYNSGGYGATTGAYSYSIDLRSSSTQLPGSVLVYPSSGSWTDSPQNVSVRCSNASKIYYTIRYTTDGSIPSEPPEPTATINDSSISGSSGIFVVRANPGENKKLKVKFRGYNSSGYGVTTWPTILYSINSAQTQVTDDYGNSCDNAFPVNVNSTINGKIETSGDYDYFKVQVPSSGTLTVYTTGSTDTYGFLKNASYVDIKSYSGYNGDNNFRISESVTAGTYYIAVRHYSSSGTGNYTLNVDFQEQVDGGNVEFIPFNEYSDYKLPAYTTENKLWQAGYAPKICYEDPAKSKLGNAKGNCTWYANGRLRQLGYDNSHLNALITNASQWDDIAKSRRIPTDGKPKPGDIAQNHSGNVGHVAVVEAVYDDGTILISESSYCPGCKNWDFFYHTRTTNKTEFPNYIHVPLNK